MGFNEFKASKSWLDKWKRRHRIVSRKITKIVSLRESTTQHRQQVENQIEEFRANFNDAVVGHDPKEIYNTDQSGFNLELLSGRTLEIRGTQKVFSNIRSKHSHTHSYTLQFLINAAGELKAPLFMIFQEKNGVFGEIVKRTMFRHPEVHAIASTSGKLTRAGLVEWLKIFFRIAGDECFLLVDSLTTYRDQALFDGQKADNQVYHIVTIPGGLTGVLQPLDVYFNRPYKAFVRRVSDHIHFFHSDTINLHARDTISRINTLVHDQFRAPRFKEFIIHSWKKSGLSVQLDIEDDDNDVREWFDDPIGYCFDDLNILNNGCALCHAKPSFIRCAWCSTNLCFTHYYSEPYFHFCENLAQANQ